MDLTTLFTDIEDSTRLWEQYGERMARALAAHDRLAHGAIQSHHGTVVKTTGDGVHAVFADPLDAMLAAVDLQHALREPTATEGLPIKVRCGIHAGEVERRDSDYFGATVGRAARIMGAAHGEQILVSDTVADRIRARIPAGLAIRDLGAIRLKGFQSPEPVWQVVDPGLRQSFPPLRSLEQTPHNLPQAVTAFIGRERA